MEENKVATDIAYLRGVAAGKEQADNYVKNAESECSRLASRVEELEACLRDCAASMAVAAPSVTFGILPKVTALLKKGGNNG